MSRSRENGSLRSASRKDTSTLRVESLEPRRVLACQGVAEIIECVPGDSDLNGEFNQLDIVQVLQGGKYLSGDPAEWSEGDWNGDGAANQLDIVHVLQADTYLREPETSRITDFTSIFQPTLTGDEGAFGGPTVIRSQSEWFAAVGNDDAAREFIQQVDFGSQLLLLFAWQGSGQDDLTLDIQQTEDGLKRRVCVFAWYDP